jgi:hypothetical protein
MTVSCAASEDVEIVVTGFSDPFFYMGLGEEERRHQVGSQNVPPPAMKNRRNSEGPGGAFRVSRVLAEFWTGFPWAVESFAFTQAVSPQGRRLLCVRVCLAFGVHRRGLRHQWIELLPGHGMQPRWARTRRAR